MNTLYKSFAFWCAAHLIGLAAPAQTLIHRYSFTSDASDSAGTANGILIGSPAISSEAVVRDGTNQLLTPVNPAQPAEFYQLVYP